LLRNCARRSKAGFFLVIAYTIEQKGLAAFGSIGILHIKCSGKLAFQSAFMCKVFPSLCVGNLLAL
jgi:hypothetical protein